MARRGKRCCHLEAIWKDVAFAWASVRQPGRFVRVDAVLRRIGDQNQLPLRLVCYWTDRREHSDGDVATVIQRYVDPRLDKKVETVVVAKAIISSGCIVRTNLEQLLTTISPKKILIAAPVMVAKADVELRAKFRATVSNKFEFLTFAEDPPPKSGWVEPGVGGNVAARLGLEHLSDRFSPRLIQEWTRAT